MLGNKKFITWFSGKYFEGRCSQAVVRFLFISEEKDAGFYITLTRCSSYHTPFVLKQTVSYLSMNVSVLSLLAQINEINKLSCSLGNTTATCLYVV